MGIPAAVAAALLLVAVPGGAPLVSPALATDGRRAERATAQVAGSVGKRPQQRQGARRAAASTVPNDPLWRDSWALPKVHAAEAWRWTTGRPGTIVAVLDTGADPGQPDLRSSLVAGYDVVDHDDDPSDDHGHGTAVSGVIAARSNNRIGVASVCWRCSLMPVKVIGADGSGQAADVAEGIRWAIEHGAGVINMSFTMSGPDPAVEQAVADAVGHGLVVVAAAGNDGTSAVTYPAAYPGVLSVAGTDAADAAYRWSSYGGWVQLAAPGCSTTTLRGGSYGDFCGTSAAAAVVSGLAALARSYAPALPGPTIAEALASSSKRIGNVVAAGRVDADALLQTIRTAMPKADPESRGRLRELALP